jgi:hypothetical protein
MKHLTCSSFILRVLLRDLVECHAIVQLLQGFFLFGVLLAQNVADVDGLGSFLSCALLFCALVGGLAFVGALAFWCHDFGSGG